MSRYKQNMGINCYEASKARIHHIYDIHDTPVVLFSGGKDSQVLLHLTHEVAQERGLKYVNAIFKQSEFILKPTLDIIDHYKSFPWLRLKKFVIPAEGNRLVFDKHKRFVQWDYKNREIIRPIPQDAIRPPDETWGSEIWYGWKLEEFVCQFWQGKIAQMMGIRASESRFRWRASVNKLIENYINAPLGYKRATLCKPLYDWEENDILKYLYDNKIPYCKQYDLQLYANMGMRTSDWLHPEKMRLLSKLRQIDPEFYDGILRIFPDQVLHEKYSEDIDKDRIIAEYGNSWEDVAKFIEKRFEDKSIRDVALYRLWQIVKLSRSERNERMGLYPIPYVLKYFIRGEIKKLLLPYRKGHKEWKKLL